MTEGRHSGRTAPSGSAVDADSVAALLAHVDAVVVGVDLTGRVTFLSPAARTVLGHEPALSVGRSVLDFMHPDDGLGSSAQPTMRILHADGTWVPMTLDIMAGPEIAPFGAVIGTLKTIGATAPAELELRARLAREDRLVRLASTFLGLDLASFDGGVHEALAQLGGLPGVDRCTVMRVRDGRVVKTHQWCGRRAEPSARDEVPLEWLEGRFGPAWRDELYFETPEHVTETDIAGLREMDDDGIRSTLAVPMLHDGRFSGFVAFGSVETGRLRGSEFLSLLRSAAGLLGEAFARHDAEVELAHRARTDLLTQIDSRWAFLDAVTAGLERLAAGEVGALALLLLDLDRFKLVNDSLGHLTGDLVLAAAAHRLRDATLPTERLGRLGGDEIVLLLEGDDPGGFRDRAAQVMAVFEEPFVVGDRECTLSASAGLVVAHPGARPEELLSQADAAMFRAKDLGRDRVELWDHDLADLISHRFRLESALRQAVRDGELELHYQPELHLPTRSIHGLEALVRWNHPADGLLSAAEFVPIAEDSGLIVDLGRWVFTEACRQLAEWQAAGRWPLMRVNVSAKQLNHPDVVDELLAIIERSGADPGFLCLELTETAVMADADLSLEVLGKLAGLGLQLAIDDFGTGYSSLSYLKRLSMHVLKIDRSFVDGLGRSSDDVAIVAAIISLAQTLGLTVTAEGIESEDQLSVLQDLGCAYGQGWLFAKALPAAEITALLDADTPFG
jgi:diguanylate cyclase (GGDEF)-like protein